MVPGCVSKQCLSVSVPPSILMWLCCLSHSSNQGKPNLCFSTPLSQLRQQRGIISQDTETLFAPIQMRDTTHSTVYAHTASNCFPLLPSPSSTYHALSLPVTTHLSSHHHTPNRLCHRRAYVFVYSNQWLPLVHTALLCVALQISRFWTI